MRPARSRTTTSAQIPFTPRAKKALELALRGARSLGHDRIGTEHILLGLVRENEGVAIRNEVIRMLSGPGRRPPAGSRPSRRVRVTTRAAPFILESDHPAQLVVACPACAAPIETIALDAPNVKFAVSAEGDRDCPACRSRWTIAYSVSWKERAE